MLFVFTLFIHYAILIMCYVWTIPHLIYGDGYLIYNITVDLIHTCWGPQRHYVVENYN